MDGTLTVDVAGESVRLLPERAVYWPRKESLFLSGLHLGRVESLQKFGRPVPSGDTEDTLRRLRSLCARLEPETVYFLGDLFHRSNSVDFVYDQFDALFDRDQLRRFVLVRGNHDRCSREDLRSIGLEYREPPVIDDPFLLTHEPTPDEDRYNLAGHLHPMVEFRDSTEQFRRPCFRFDRESGVLPAFTQLANGVPQEPREDRRIYVDAGSKVIQYHD